MDNLRDAIRLVTLMNQQAAWRHAWQAEHGIRVLDLIAVTPDIQARFEAVGCFDVIAGHNQAVEIYRITSSGVILRYGDSEARAGLDEVIAAHKWWADQNKD